MEPYLISEICKLRNARVKNELKEYAWGDDRKKKFKINKSATLCEVVQNQREIEATFIFDITKNKSTVVNIYFENRRPYPFYPPNVKLFGHYNYHGTLGLINLKLLNINSRRCLCCESLLCKNNWSVRHTIGDLFNEIKKNLILRMRTVDLINCKHVVNQKFGHYVPIDTFL